MPPPSYGIHNKSNLRDLIPSSLEKFQIIGDKTPGCIDPETTSASDVRKSNIQMVFCPPTLRCEA